MKMKRKEGWGEERKSLITDGGAVLQQGCGNRRVMTGVQHRTHWAPTCMQPSRCVATVM